MPDETETQPAPAKFVLKIPIAKAGKAMDVDFNALPPEIKKYVAEQGLSKLLNAATAKETKSTTPDDATRAANAFALAEKKLESLKAGKLVSRAKKSDGKVAGEVMTEARRQAKIIVKASIKAHGGKISEYTAKAITEAANNYIEANPALIAGAQTAVDAAKALAAGATLDVSAIPVDPKLVAANEAKKAAARAATEAKNAGKPGPQKSATKKQAGKVLPVVPKRAPAEVHAQH